MNTVKCEEKQHFGKFWYCSFT